MKKLILIVRERWLVDGTPQDEKVLAHDAAIEIAHSGELLREYLAKQDVGQNEPD